MAPWMNLVKLPLALGVLAACAGCTGSGGRASDAQAFENAVAQVGCTVGSYDQAQKVEQISGLSPDQLGDILQSYAQEGWVVPNEDGFRLIIGPCAP